MILRNIKKHNSGFTLVESLVAISILMVAIVTPMTIAQNGLSSAMYSKDQMTASFLAQDAIEYIKNKRDEIGVSVADPLNPPNWLGQLNDCINKICYIDTQKEISTGAISNNINDSVLYVVRKNLDNTFLYYGFRDNTGDKVSALSKFTRTIKITNPNNPDEALIDVTVSWQNGGNTETVEIKNFIYNYWENL